MRGIRSERKHDVSEPFPSLTAHSCVYLLQWLRVRVEGICATGRGLTSKSFEFQCWIVKVHQSPAPTSLTWISLTMETFSPWVRGRLLLWEKKKEKLTAPYFLYLATTGNTLQLKALHTARLLFDSQPSRRADRQTAGKLTRVHETSQLQWLLKIPPRLEHVRRKQVLAQQDKAGPSKSAPSLSLHEISKNLVMWWLQCLMFSQDYRFRFCLNKLWQSKMVF